MYTCIPAHAQQVKVSCIVSRYHPGSCCWDCWWLGLHARDHENEEHHRSGGLHHVGISCHAVAPTICSPRLVVAVCCAFCTPANARVRAVVGARKNTVAVVMIFPPQPVHGLPCSLHPCKKLTYRLLGGERPLAVARRREATAARSALG